jgi:hypothetical protein
VEHTDGDKDRLRSRVCEKSQIAGKIGKNGEKNWARARANLDCSVVVQSTAEEGDRDHRQPELEAERRFGDPVHFLFSAPFPLFFPDACTPDVSDLETDLFFKKVGQTWICVDVLLVLFVGGFLGVGFFVGQ